MPRHLSAISLLTCAILTACTTTTTTTPTPTPSPTCTPEAGGTPYPCNQHDHDHDQLATKEKLYLEAEAVYRKFFAEEERIYRAGGTNKPTPILLETTTGQYLNDSMNIYSELTRSKTRLVKGSFKIASVEPRPGISKHGSVVALEACVDASQATLRNNSGEVRGTSGVEVLFFTRAQSVLRVALSEWKDAESC